MNTEKNVYETTKKQEPGSVGAMAEDILERGDEFYARAERAGSEALDKTGQAVSETYDKVTSYTSQNPGKTILIAFGIGVGVGLLLGAGSHRSRTGRFAEPVVNALSDIALEIFR